MDAAQERRRANTAIPLPLAAVLLGVAIAIPVLVGVDLRSTGTKGTVGDVAAAHPPAPALEIPTAPATTAPAAPPPAAASPSATAQPRDRGTRPARERPDRPAQVPAAAPRVILNDLQILQNARGQVIANATLRATAALTVQDLVVLVRRAGDSGAYDFAHHGAVALTPQARTFSGDKVFGAGTYTCTVAYLLNNVWHTLQPSRTFTIAAPFDDGNGTRAPAPGSEPGRETDPGFE